MKGTKRTQGTKRTADSEAADSEQRWMRRQIAARLESAPDRASDRAAFRPLRSAKRGNRHVPSELQGGDAAPRGQRPTERHGRCRRRDATAAADGRYSDQGGCRRSADGCGARAATRPVAERRGVPAARRDLPARRTTDPKPNAPEVEPPPGKDSRGRPTSRLPTREDEAGGGSEPKRTVGPSFAADGKAEARQGSAKCAAFQPKSQAPTRGTRRPANDTSDAAANVVNPSDTIATGVGRCALKCGSNVRRIVMCTR